MQIKLYAILNETTNQLVSNSCKDTLLYPKIFSRSNHAQGWITQKRNGNPNSRYWTKNKFCVKYVEGYY